VTDSRLIIMRHAKSDWSTGASGDFDRPLASRGERDGVRMGKWLMEQQLIPNCFVSSPARRARETSDLVAEELEIPVADIIWAEQIYAASLEELLGVVEAYSSDVSCLLLVGHNPGLDELLCYLALEQPTPTLKGKLMTTASAAVLNFGRKAISVRPNSATLDILVRPKELAA
jgi:phosphohistidine phosphatase